MSHVTTVTVSIMISDQSPEQLNLRTICKSCCSSVCAIRTRKWWQMPLSSYISFIINMMVSFLSEVLSFLNYKFRNWNIEEKKKLPQITHNWQVGGRPEVDSRLPNCRICTVSYYAVSLSWSCPVIIKLIVLMAACSQVLRTTLI